MKTITLFLACLFISINYAQDIELETFGTGFTNPVNIKHAGDDLLYVVERDGFIKILNSDGTVNPTAFLDIDDLVIDFGGEQGLLAVAFHPNYITNGFFYVNYINNDGDTVISRFTRSTPTTADENSEVVMLTITQPYSNHNGGDLHFGTDGYLYISLGDGGSGGDPENYAQRLNTLLGKMLRIDVNVSQVQIDAGTTYLIPSDNPFVSDSAALDEIWAYGLRNPWKFSFDRTTGDLWTADVGQLQIEEINKVSATSVGGENYGWKCFEGTMTFQTSTTCDEITHHEPIAEYNHGGGRCSITGGYVYRGTEQSSLQGLYFFADFCSNDIGYVEETSPGNFNLTLLGAFSGGGWSAFGEDINGELYVTSLFNGIVYKVVESNLSVDEPSISDIKMYPNPATNNVTFDLLNNSNPIQEINIHDVQGKLVTSRTNFDAQLITISTKALTSGLYLVEIISSQGRKSIRKLVVE
ncbi:PQQ-dependent sugar dehydrogenase [Psychroserpens sp. SPM9]|uniref:PQQ-dependent sugar dehydrogenase n=1 Tax=Psychroserpens sp. SPM9 TaxID=2975598 RepID=UPI0021A30109|nr:PQQ-dependent sugar dehydrogenase [Psychroserpens sp. SPM9]MDG5491686.1 PQQ-dependent sugar dehydrogenase [Psychroserpens sp. SPM9]